MPSLLGQKPNQVSTNGEDSASLEPYAVDPSTPQRVWAT
jgi:hypothetical protein